MHNLFANVIRRAQSDIIVRTAACRVRPAMDGPEIASVDADAPLARPYRVGGFVGVSIGDPIGGSLQNVGTRHWCVRARMARHAQMVQRHMSTHGGKMPPRPSTGKAI